MEVLKPPEDLAGGGQCQNVRMSYIQLQESDVVCIQRKQNDWLSKDHLVG